MQKEVILKSFGTGQITLPKKWRERFPSPYFRAYIQKNSIIIKPLDPDNVLGVEETNEKIDEPGWEKILDARELGYKRGIPSDIFLQALKEVNEEEDGQNS